MRRFFGLIRDYLYGWKDDLWAGASYVILPQIAEALHCSIDDLFTETQSVANESA